MSGPVIQLLPDTPSTEDLHQLAALLHATVHGGASVSFILPFSEEDALLWWQTKVIPHIASRSRIVLIARHGSDILGSVQLLLEMPPNQQHRAEVAKLLVHPAARRRGIARALMLQLEQYASAASRSLLTLDTVTGGAAEPLYLSLGYQQAGIIPGFARQSHHPVLEATTIFYKHLPPGML